MSSAFFGGSFDPIHYAHVEVISELSQRFDKVFVMVNNNWTKQKSLYSFDQRNKALKIICKKYKNIQVLEWGKIEDTSSTYLVVKKIKEQFKTNPYIVIGSDNTQSIEKWKHWDKMKTECNFLIFTRDNIPVINSPPSSLIVNWSSKFFGLSSSKIRNENLTGMIPEEVRYIFKDTYEN